MAASTSERISMNTFMNTGVALCVWVSSDRRRCGGTGQNESWKEREQFEGRQVAHLMTMVGLRSCALVDCGAMAISLGGTLHGG